MGRTRDWESWIDQQIREAQEQGAFENLPGRGKPLDLTPNPYAQDRELAFKVLKDAGYAPDWIELDKAIRMRLDRARQTLARSRGWWAVRLRELEGLSDGWAHAERERVSARWEEAIASFRAEVAAINVEIAELNLKVPGARFQRSQVDASQELDQIESVSE